MFAGDGDYGYGCEGVPFEDQKVSSGVQEEPIAEEPIFEEPVSEEPVVEEPVVEQPVVEEACC